MLASPGPSAPGGTPPPGTRLRAAAAVLGWLLQVWELASLEARGVELAVLLTEKVEAVGDQVEWSPEEMAVFEHLARVNRERCRSRA